MGDRRQPPCLSWTWLVQRIDPSRVSAAGSLRVVTLGRAEICLRRLVMGRGRRGVSVLLGHRSSALVRRGRSAVGVRGAGARLGGQIEGLDCGLQC
jgi:hypothetical protein